MSSLRTLMRPHRLPTSSCRRTMSTKAAFGEVPMGLPDPIQTLSRQYESDTDPVKVDLGAGVLRDERGRTHEFGVVRKAKRVLEERQLDHDYRPTIGIESYRKHAARLMFGSDSAALNEGRIATIQTVAGTGACRTGAVLLNKHWPSTSTSGTTGPIRNPTPIYVGTPTWTNYAPLFQHAGFPDFRTYDHLSGKTFGLDFDATVSALKTAPEGSVFVFQAVCHNPTGRDFSREQWSRITDLLLARRHFAYMDAAYQSLGSGAEDDAWAVRHMASRGVDMPVCQSFSKNMGLYSERVGALHVVCQTPGIAARVLDQLRTFIRWEVSSSPAYGAQLVETILSDRGLEGEWQGELRTARERLGGLRAELHGLLVGKYGTPSPRTGTAEGWRHVLEEKGLFSWTGLSGEQARMLREKHHVYLPGTGRINVSGLNGENVGRVAQAFDAVIRS